MFHLPFPPLHSTKSTRRSTTFPPSPLFWTISHQVHLKSCSPQKTTSLYAHRSAQQNSHKMVGVISCSLIAVLYPSLPYSSLIPFYLLPLPNSSTHTPAALHALLHWRQAKDTAIPKILTDIIKVPGDEIMKVCEPVLMCRCPILHHSFPSLPPSLSPPTPSLPSFLHPPIHTLPSFLYTVLGRHIQCSLCHHGRTCSLMW